MKAILLPPSLWYSGKITNTQKYGTKAFVIVGIFWMFGSIFFVPAVYDTVKSNDLVGAYVFLVASIFAAFVSACGYSEIRLKVASLKTQRYGEYESRKPDVNTLCF